MTFEETTRANDSPAKDIIAMVLLVIAAIGGIVAIFFRPFGFGPVALLARDRRDHDQRQAPALGLCVTGGDHALLS